MTSKEVILRNMGCFEALEDYLLIDHVLEGMDVYAEQVAIGFPKWLAKNFWPLGEDEYLSATGDTRFTVEELYEMYAKRFR